MIAVPLQLVRSRTPAATCAWLIPGGDAAAWLDEIASLGVSAADLQVFVVPQGPSDSSAGALLVVPHEAPVEFARGGRALALARHGTRLLVPADARLLPPIDGAELDRLLTRALHLLHPVYGMIAFDDADALTVADLLTPSVRSGVRWDAADPGIRAPELRGVHAAESPTADTVLAEGKGDASTKPLEELPPKPLEGKRPLDKRLKTWFAKLTLRMTKDAPRTASAPTWINHVEDWANRRLREDIEIERLREIARLLHLLRTDPDAGLQFALPVAGFAGRGVAPPGGKLGARRTDFDARRLGGAPTDHWDLPPETTRDLTALYREQAERAIRAGRHRRAAYVFAHLLGDLRAAANALERGGHYREAAALYRDRLKDAAAAAQCLERGGLLTEAVTLYLEIGDRLRAAALLDRVGRRREAEGLWREVVTELRSANDRVAAAALLAKELRAPDEALDALDEAWPLGGQADGRLSAALHLLGQLGRGDEACRWVRRAREPLPTPVVPIVKVLSGTAVSHPDARCRDESSDAVRVLVGRELSARMVVCSGLLASLVASDRGDRLLRRDAARFEATRVAHRSPGARAPAGYEVQCKFELPPLIPDSLVVVPAREGMLVLGTRENGLGIELHSLTWTGTQRTSLLRWALIGPRGRRAAVRVNELERRILIGYPGGGPRLFHQALRDTDGRDWSVLTPAWVPDGLRGMCAGAALSTWSLVDLAEEPGYLATSHGQTGVALRTAALRGEFANEIVPAVNVGGVLVIAAPNLLRVGPKGAVEEFDASQSARALVAAPGHLGSAFVAVGEKGCRLWRMPPGADPVGTSFADDAERPEVGFLGDGRIVVVEAERLRLFQRNGDGVERVLDEAWSSPAPLVALVAGVHEREVSIVTAPGGLSSAPTLMRLRFPAR